MLRFAGCLIALVIGGALAAVGQTPPDDASAGLDLKAIANWPLERVELKGGKVVHGLVRAREPFDTAQTVAVEIVHRQAGRPMNTLVRSFPKESIAKVDFLPDDERARLIARLEWFRNRGAYQSQELAQLVLKEGPAGGAKWIYEDGPWFRLESWTDREMTRLSLEYDALNLSQGFPDFPAPEEVRRAAQAAIDEGVNQYTVTWGIPALRVAIAEKARRFNGLDADPATEVTVTCGAAEALACALLGLVATLVT